ncbi:MAG: neutral zinc metallopeptidase [Solirubrobacterales bacterium]|nr:neutral zinc metallopeptidase [Solirubrobacterales bacterium]
MACLWLALALGGIAAGCGSSGASASSAHSAASPATVGHELDVFPSVMNLPATTLPHAPTSARVERAYLVALFDDAQSVWRRDFTAAHKRYKAARLVVFDGVIHSACGKHDDSGPFYCPGDDTVYLDVRFFAMLLRDKRVGAAAQAYIVGHELAHQVQRLAGVAAHVDALNRQDPGRENARTVQVELQADCLAGVWGRSAFPRSGLNLTDLDDALKTANALGDDYLQEAAGNVVDTALFTHGSSAQRTSWLRTGYRSGSPGSCDTFAAR